jgi:hypothetical protein
VSKTQSRSGANIFAMGLALASLSVALCLGAASCEDLTYGPTPSAATAGETSTSIPAAIAQATTTATEPAGPDGGPHTGPTTAASATSESIVFLGVGVDITVATQPQLDLLLTPEHNGQTFEVHVGDYVVVELPFEDLRPDWVDPDPSKIHAHVNVYPQCIEAICMAAATGTVQLRVRWRDSGAIIVSSWSANLVITE